MPSAVYTIEAAYPATTPAEQVALIIAGLRETFKMSELEVWQMVAREYRKRLPRLRREIAGQIARNRKARVRTREAVAA